MAVNPDPLDVQAIRSHFTFPELGRIVTNNAASTQPPRELLALYSSLGPGYENVHRGQSTASQAMTALFERALDDIARFIGAPDRASIALYRNTTEAVNAVMYSMLTEFRDGDNVVTTMMEHNSNYVPWYAMCREILPRFGRRVHYRLRDAGHPRRDHLRAGPAHPAGPGAAPGPTRLFWDRQAPRARRRARRHGPHLRLEPDADQPGA